MIYQYLFIYLFVLMAISTLEVMSGPSEHYTNGYLNFR